MEEFLYYNELFDLYGDLLTNKERDYFKDYYFNNLSFSEMADNYNVSRNAIFKQLKIAKEKLEEFERILNLLKKKKKLLEIMKSIKDEKLIKQLETLLQKRKN